MEIKGVIFDMDGVMIDSELQSDLGWLWAANHEKQMMPLSLIDSFKGATKEGDQKRFNEYYRLFCIFGR